MGSYCTSRDHIDAVYKGVLLVGMSNAEVQIIY